MTKTNEPRPQNPTKLFPLILTNRLEETKRYYTEVAGFRVVYDLPAYLQVAYGDGDGPELCFMKPDGFPDGQARPAFDRKGVIVSVPTPDAEEKHAQLSSALFSLRFRLQEQASQNLGELRQAINQRRRLQFGYENEAGESTVRTTRPLGLYFWGRSWTLAAYCELREDFRTFRSDRIRDLVLLEDTFELAARCTLEAYEAAARERDGARIQPPQRLL